MSRIKVRMRARLEVSNSKRVTLLAEKMEILELLRELNDGYLVIDLDHKGRSFIVSKAMVEILK